MVLAYSCVSTPRRSGCIMNVRLREEWLDLAVAVERCGSTHHEQLYEAGKVLHQIRVDVACTNQISGEHSSCRAHLD